MTILVTGANGQLGTEMRLISRGSQDKYIFSDVNDVEGQETVHLDITDIDAVRKLVTECEVDAIVNCAAYTNVDAAEDNYDLAEKLNAEAPAKLAQVMAERNGLLVHISTDYVFGGADQRTPYREDAVGEPTGVYGVTKLHGENAIIESGCKYVIIRTAWLYSEYGKNFCKTMLSLTSSRPEIKVVADQFGTPTYAADLAVAIYSIVSSRSYEGNTGIYHFSNEGSCNWHEFASEIYSRARVIAPERPECTVLPCTSDEYPSKVKRPAYSVLDKTLIKETFGLTIPSWEDSLDACLKNLLK